VELTKVPKSGGRRQDKKKGSKKKMRPVCGRRATAGCSPAAGLSNCGISVFKFFDFFDFDFFLFGVMRNFLAFWENGCTTPPFFEACPYTWKC
jgi:hypothetical protein